MGHHSLQSSHPSVQADLTAPQRDPKHAEPASEAPSSSKASLPPSARPSFRFVEATSTADANRIKRFEQALAEETEGHGLDEASVTRGALGATSAPHLAFAFLAYVDRGETDADAGSENSGDEEPVGYVAASKQWSVWHGGYLVYILSAYVIKEYRGAGLFSQMYARLRAQVEGDRLSVGIRLNVEQQNERAQKAYEKLGMRIECYDMYKWLKPTSQFPANVHGVDHPLPGEQPTIPEAHVASDQLVIRLAEPKDLAELVEMQKDFAREIHDGEELDDACCRRGVAMPWAEPSIARIYVAADRETDAPVGMVVVTNEWSGWRGGIIHWLTGCYVKPDWRRKGVFGALFHFAKDHVTADDNTVGIRMQVRRGNAAAERCAEKLGLAKEGYYLMKWVDPNGAGANKHPK